MNAPRTVAVPIPLPISEVDTHRSKTTGSDTSEVEAAPEQAGRFKLLWELARGGMGVVYRAFDPDLNRIVAIKLIRGSGATGMGLKLRFLEEAKVTAQLQHPGIPPVHEVGELPDGRPYLAMKLIKGRTLAEEIYEPESRIANRPKLVAVFESICQTVGFAHSNGVLHRDLKPQNIMVGAFGEVQVMDWGLARAAQREEQKHSGASELKDAAAFETLSGSILGTPAYAAPEQVRGDLDKVSTRSDVFGLGGILCAILTGHPPFDGRDGESTVLQAAEGNTRFALERLAKCGADPDLIELCKRCLAVDPKDRFENGGAVADAVAQFRAAADERAKFAEVERGKAETAQLAQRKRQRIILAALVGVALVGLIAGWQWFRAEGATQVAQGEQKKTEGALLLVKDEKKKTEEALDAKNDEQKKTAAALDAVNASRLRTLEAVRQLTREAAQRPFPMRSGLQYSRASAPPETRSKVALLWKEFESDLDPYLACEAKLWIEMLNADVPIIPGGASAPIEAVRVQENAAKRIEAILDEAEKLPADAKRIDFRRAMAYAPAATAFLRTFGLRQMPAADRPECEQLREAFRIAARRLGELVAEFPTEGGMADDRVRAIEAISTLSLPGEKTAILAEILRLQCEAAAARRTPFTLQSRESAYEKLIASWTRVPERWPDEAEKILKGRIEAIEECREAKTNSNVVGARGRARAALGQWYAFVKKYPDAEREFQTAIELHREEQNRIPLPQFAIDLAVTYTAWGECQLEAGKPKEARASFEKAKGIMPVPDPKKSNPFGAGFDWEIDAADTLAWIALAQLRCGNAEVAEKAAEEARQLYAASAGRYFGSKTASSAFPTAAPCVLRTLLRYDFERKGPKVREALATATESLQQLMKRPIRSEYELPLRLELARVRLILTDPKNPDEADVAAAMIDLRIAVASGLRWGKVLCEEPAFAVIRERPEFRKLLEQLPEPKK